GSAGMAGSVGLVGSIDRSLAQRRSGRHDRNRLYFDQQIGVGEAHYADGGRGRAKIGDVLHSHGGHALPELANVVALAFEDVVGVQLDDVGHRAAGLGEDLLDALEDVSGLEPDIAFADGSAVLIGADLAADDDPADRPLDRPALAELDRHAPVP